MNYLKILTENKNTNSFAEELKNLVRDDQKARQLYREFKADSEKIVEYIDYVMSKYFQELEQLMKKYSLSYEDIVNTLVERVH